MERDGTGKLTRSAESYEDESLRRLWARGRLIENCLESWREYVCESPGDGTRENGRRSF
jgi:hypothetical protein